MKHLILIVALTMLYNQAISQVRETIAFSIARIQDPGDAYNLIRSDQDGNVIWSHDLTTDNTPHNYSDDFYIVCGYTTVVGGKIIANPGDYDYWLVLRSPDPTVNVYPNPTSDLLNVVLNNLEQNTTVRLYNTQMKLITIYNIDNYRNLLALPQLANAIYIMETRVNNSVINIQKICVQQN